MPKTSFRAGDAGRRVVDVVGVGADGWPGLTLRARRRLADADVIVGSRRQLGLVPAEVAGDRVLLPSPLHPGLAKLLDTRGHERVCVLASGDPMFFGIGGTLVRLIGEASVRIEPHPSSVSFACARLGWAQESTVTVSTVARPFPAVAAALQPQRRLLVLVCEPDAPTRLARLLREHGYGASTVTVLERLGADDERVTEHDAATFPATEFDPLTVVGVFCRLAAGARALPMTPGLPDDAFDSDGQMTKREVRAVTLAALGPSCGELLWDVGAGTGTIATEWMRTHPECRAVAVEPRADRRERIAHNAERLGVPALRIVAGQAPEALRDLPEPDAVFIGGGVTVDGVMDACLNALRPGGRLVANVVTVEGELTLGMWHARLGGDLTRISVSRAAAVGQFTGWRSAMPVTQWRYASELTT